ncbi:WhiB family transcriptional regulator [Actinokineospora enzanensis]|uniref:WhiB family transcriptional regulator n=1 Tax=Actinokineospora enzanensis TaxID=155975 RepID=UPI00146F074A
MDSALCAQTDPDAFHPERGGVRAAPARQVCGRCEVRVECGAYARSTGQADGVWGGQTARQRRLSRRSDGARR